MHSRDATVLIDLLWFNVVHNSSLFQYFFQATMVKIPNLLVYTCILLGILLWLYSYAWFVGGSAYAWMFVL